MYEREPTSKLEPLEVDFQGAKHRGQRLVLTVSDTEVRQEVRYASLRQVDPDTYQAREAEFMRSKAVEILFRLVAQWQGNAARRPRKPAPRPRHRSPEP